jgi:hypothetical protein
MGKKPSKNIAATWKERRCCFGFKKIKNNGKRTSR